MQFISECSLFDLITHLQTSQLNPEDLINDLCDKLDEWDDQIKAFLPEENRRERLLDDFSDLNDRFPDPEKRPPLFGIPIGVKDIFHVNGFETKAGSDVPSEVLQGKEADVVTKLKQAGALILGKTVTTEFAYFHPGPTCNPHNFSHTPGGSSSGSAAAVAAGFCPLAIGTQTIGSISRPASFCGTIGFKPSYSRIPVQGVIPFSRSADHVGFFTQDIIGSELIASLLCDEWNSALPDLERKPVIGIPEGDYLHQASDEMLKEFYKVTDNFKQKGFTVKTVEPFRNIDQINSDHKLMNAAEFADVHSDWLKRYKQFYKPATIELIERGQSVTFSALRSARENRLKVRNELENIQTENEIDVWISPSSVTTALKGLGSTGDPAMNLPWTYAGVPTLSIPFGFIGELPFGIQFAGKFYQDENLFKVVIYIMNIMK